jgi:hypothetical protein
MVNKAVAMGQLVTTNNALQRTNELSGRPVLAKGWRARRGGMVNVPAAELDR